MNSALAAAATTKATVNRQLLTEALEQARSTTDKRSEIPVLRCVLLRVDGERLWITGTDLEVFARRWISAEPCDLWMGETSAVALPCKRLIAWLKALDAPTVSIEIDRTEATAAFTGMPGQTATIPGASAESFPVLPVPEKWDAETVMVGSHSLQLVAQNVRTAICCEESHYMPNGALFLFEPGKVTGVATDGHRLAMQVVECAWQGMPTRVLIPKTAVDLLAAEPRPGQCEISFFEEWVRFSFGNREVITRKVDGKFPNYERVLPQSHEHAIEIESRDVWIAAVSRLLAFPDWHDAGRLLIGHGAIRLCAGDLGEKATEMLAVDYEAPKVEVGLNLRYLLNALGGLTERGTFFFSDPLKNVVEIRDGEGYRALVMPIRL